MREGGVEPPRPKAPDPKSGVAAVTPLPRRSRSLGVALAGVLGGRVGELTCGVVWQAVAVPRDPRQIQLEIDAARESLAATLDQLTLPDEPRPASRPRARTPSQRFLQTPAGMATVGAVGLLVTCVDRPEDPAPQRLTCAATRSARARSRSGTTRARRRPR